MKFKYMRYVLGWSPFRQFIDRIKNIRFKRWNNVSLYTIVKLFLRNLYQDEIISRANSVAFNFTLAIFPAIIFLFTLIPYVSLIIPEVNSESILNFIAQLIPPNMFKEVEATITDIVSNQRGGLLTFGFLFSLYLATNGMMALMEAFNAVYKTNDRRSAVKMRLIATALTLNLAFVLFLAIVLLVVGQLVLDYLMNNLSEYEWLNNVNLWLLFLLRFFVIFIAFFLAVSTIYYFGPAIHYNWRFFSVGSFLATILILIVSYGFSYYITHFGTYNKVYGSIGVLIALMIWIQLIAVVLLVGYELNASIHDAARMQALWQGRRFNCDSAS
jgi:membrane protein